MKKPTIHTLLALALLAFLPACESNKNTDNDNADKDTVVVIQQPAPADSTQDTVTTETTTTQHKAETKPQPKAKTTPTPPPVPKEEPKKEDYRVLLKEYHEILCRQHLGTGTTDDKIRQAELTRELMLIRKKLPTTEKFTFTAEMARAANMENCK